MRTICFLITAGITLLSSQHKLPFASQNNAIELSVANSANVDAGNVTVTVSNVPSWIRFNNLKSEIQNLKSGEVSTSRFTFSVDKSAPVGKEHTLQFVISSPSGEKWTKEIAIQIAAPEQFELYQNYPNPFNPATTISFQLPAASVVSLKVFDVVGREVVTLADGIQEAGYHRIEWNARNVASGMYVYQIVAETAEKKKEIVRKTMLLLK